MKSTPNGVFQRLVKLPRGTPFAWILRIALAMVFLLTLLLVALLTRAMDQRSLNDQNIRSLLLINVSVALVLLSGIALITWRLIARVRSRQFGSRLLLKLATVFIFVGFTPGLLIYMVSYQFVSRSIESWFNVRVESALEAGLLLGRASLDNIALELTQSVERTAARLDLTQDKPTAMQLETLREQVGALDVQLWSASSFIAGSGNSRYSLMLDKPTATQLKRLREQGRSYQFEGLDTEEPEQAGIAQVKVMLLLKTANYSLAGNERVLVVSSKLPAPLVQNALRVQNAYSEYQERALTRQGLQKMYIGTLTLSLFLALLSAFVLAVILSNQMVKPLLELAKGVRNVHEGDLTPIEVSAENNELAQLTRAFSDMTQQLAHAREAEQKSQRIAAWNEVAQRVAHEIKNPLTPIQLSAERLRSKLHDRLQESDQALLAKSVGTIVDQVEAMKRLVNEFRDYARLPAPQMSVLHFEDILNETLGLYENQMQQGLITLGRSHGSLPAIDADAQLLRQVLHNLIQNALDAAHETLSSRPQVVIEMHADAVHLCVDILDNGRGFPPDILAHAFEPYNTTKPKGTGLGLAVVKKVLTEHQGEITVANRHAPDASVVGAVVSLRLRLHAAIAGA